MKIIKKNLMFAKEIASTSHAMANQVKKLVDKHELKINVIPFGVDIEKFKMKENYNNFSDITIGIIKKISKKYGIKYLIEAIKILIDDLNSNGYSNISKNLKLFIYGDGDQREELEDLSIRLGLEKTIKFMGKIPNEKVPEALEKMDIFVVSSILNSESFGVAVVEAMSAGLPVVATDVDGFKEVVEDKVTGLIVEKENPFELAEGLKELILNYELRKSMGIAGRKRVEKYYNLNDNVQSMISVYERLASRK